LVGVLIPIGIHGILIFILIQKLPLLTLIFVIPLLIAMMLMTVILVILDSQILQYKLENQVLHIHCWWGNYELDLANATVEIFQIKSIWRMFGTRTVRWSIVNHEDIQIYGANLKSDVIMIRQAGKNTIITPADPQAFLKLVEESRV
jgi:hypothetical protein